ncbi:lysosomal alpha-glucosidase-like isoform X2 [Tubulanus polymorphus]|uniref:lysosomal alpha-glucosidase-like isoform X2 n=1 Tax=Tubulanus polymorphus TaxID=672921 RepID=UPI003DA69895
MAANLLLFSLLTIGINVCGFPWLKNIRPVSSFSGGNQDDRLDGKPESRALELMTRKHPRGQPIKCGEYKSALVDDVICSKALSSADCLSERCCWNFHDSKCSLPKSQPRVPDRCNTPDEIRIDCHPEPGASPESCIARGCCWRQSERNGIPYCFYERSNSGYDFVSDYPTPMGFTVYLRRQTPSRWPNDIPNIKVDISYESNTRLHFKIYDQHHPRYEVPLEVPVVKERAASPEYDVSFTESPFSLKVTRRKTGSVLFDSSKTLLTFADQFIEISTTLPTRYIYGLGEHQGPFLHDATKPLKYTFWAHDQPPLTGYNLYGSHPFMLAMEEDGQSYGIFLLNSNAMEVDIDPGTPPLLTYRTLGGILDFYIFTGPCPDAVVSQYNDVIGHPFMPPYWALGFHLCRWGYANSTDLKNVIQRMRDGKFPQDVQWNDLDYMGSRRDWSLDRTHYGDLPNIVNDLHQNGQHYIMLVDPGINNVTGYGPFDDGIKMDVFVKKFDNSGPIYGKVWPGITAFPDFTHPNAEKYWGKQAAQFHNLVNFDGMWLDMNEPSNFVTGSTEGCPKNNSLDHPPYVPPVLGGTLYQKTLCPSAKQSLSSHYNLHNMYGYFEMKASYRSFTNFTKKRTLLIGRSTFPGTGKYAGHWTGDVTSSWQDLKNVIPGVLNFNMFGMPMVGSDICGFIGNTNEELCVRWTQLGVFSPFMRNHNDQFSTPQDPASPSFSKMGRDCMRRALELRYILIPYLYTLLYDSHKFGQAAARPLFFQFPKDKTTYGIDRQFMWGDALLISPVLEQGQTEVTAYFPEDTWYDYFIGTKVQHSGATAILPAPLGHINVHIRAGTIVPVQTAELTTTTSRKNPFGLTVAMPNGSQFQPFTGKLYWDDGVTLMDDTKDIGNIIQFTVQKVNSSTTEMTAKQITSNYRTTMILGHVRVLGVKTRPSKVTVNQKTITFQYHDNNKELRLDDVNATLMSDVTIVWT